MMFLFVLLLALLVRLTSCAEVVFDLSSPDSSLVRDYESTVDGVVHHSFFSTGLFFSKVLDGGVTLWAGKGEERCDVLFSSVGNGKNRAVLHVWTKDLPSRMLHYEKLDGEWRLVTVRVKGVPESEEPVSPQEPIIDLDFATLGCLLQGSSGAGAKPKVTLPPVKPQDDDEEELGELDEYVPETKVEDESHVEDFSESQPEEVTPKDEKSKNVVTGSTISTESKEVTEEEPDQQSGDNSAEPVKSESNPITVQESTPEVPEDFTEDVNESEDITYATVEHDVKESEPAIKDGESLGNSEKISEYLKPEDSSLKQLEEKSPEHSAPTPTESPKNHLIGASPKDESPNPTESKKEVSTEVPQDVSTPVTLDLTSQDKDKSQSFDYSFAGNTIRLIVLKKGFTVSKLINGKEKVYTPSSGEKFDHTKVYLNKDGKAELVLVVTTSSGASKEYYLELKDGKWVSCDDHDAKIKSLKDTTEWKSDFEIDLSASKLISLP